MRGPWLGLPVSENLVREMGGSLTMESKVGAGTCFRVLLNQTADAATDEQSEAHAAGGAKPVALSVMIIDDDVDLLRSLERSLGRSFKVRAYASAGEALDELESGTVPDAILCDVMMPQMTGAEFLQALRASNPDLAKRVLLMTGGAHSPETAKFLSDTQQPYIFKPFGLDELKTLLTETATAAAK